MDLKFFVNTEGAAGEKRYALQTFLRPSSREAVHRGMAGGRVCILKDWAEPRRGKVNKLKKKSRGIVQEVLIFKRFIKRGQRKGGKNAGTHKANGTLTKRKERIKTSPRSSRREGG